MMTRRWMLPAVAAGIFGLSLTVTWMARGSAGTPAPALSPMAAWLGLSEQQEAALGRQNAEFAEQLEGRRHKLDGERLRLAGMLERPEVSDEALRAQFDAVIDAGNQLERLVAEHLIRIRPHLSGVQQQRLFGLCADTVRQCCRPGAEAGCAKPGGKCPDSCGPECPRKQAVSGGT